MKGSRTSCGGELAHTTCSERSPTQSVKAVTPSETAAELSDVEQVVAGAR